MPIISPDDRCLGVFNLFDTTSAEKQERLLDAHRDIIDNAAYPGWISSTVHGAADPGRWGTANYVRFRTEEELDRRFAGQRFRKETVPLFRELSTAVTLIRAEIVYAQTHPSLGGTIEIAPERDDCTVITVFGVAPENQKELVDVLARPDEAVREFPGYRSHHVLRSLDGTHIVNYAQWDTRESYERFHHLPEEERPAEARRLRARGRSLLTSRTAATYRVAHSRVREATAAPGSEG